MLADDTDLQLDEVDDTVAAHKVSTCVMRRGRTHVWTADVCVASHACHHVQAAPSPTAAAPPRVAHQEMIQESKSQLYQMVRLIMHHITRLA